MVFSINIIDYTKYHIEDLEPYVEVICKELDMPDNVTIVIVPLDKRIAKKYYAVTSQTSLKLYQIAITNNIYKKQAIKVFIHEMVHICDMAKGDLYNIPGTKNFMYHGTIYERNKNNEYSAPFEIRAKKETNRIYHKLKKLL